MRTQIGDVVGLAVAGLLLAACGSKEQPPAKDQVSKPSIAALSAAAAASNTIVQPPAHAAPPPGTPAPPGGAPPSGEATRSLVLNDDGLEVGLAQIHEALKVFMKDTERFPNSLEEMVKMGVIPRIPSPPAGKKYMLDPKAKTVQLVNR